MNHFGDVLANAERRCAAIRARYAREDAAERRGGNGKKIRGAPLTDGLDGPLLGNKNSRGPDDLTRKVAWACAQLHEDVETKEIARGARISWFNLKKLVERYEALGGMKDGTIMNSGELGFKAVSLLARRMNVAAPCDSDLKRWLKSAAGQKFLMSISKGAADVKEYALKHDLIQEGLESLGFTPCKIARVGKIVGKQFPTLDDVTTFFARYPDQEAQVRIATERGIPRPKCLLTRLRKMVIVPDEQRTEKRLGALAAEAEAEASAQLKTPAQK
jgi:hypothetical protein